VLAGLVTGAIRNLALVLARDDANHVVASDGTTTNNWVSFDNRAFQPFLAFAAGKIAVKLPRVVIE
jgi:hypothetical protein